MWCCKDYWMWNCIRQWQKVTHQLSQSLPLPWDAEAGFQPLYAHKEGSWAAASRRCHPPFLSLVISVTQCFITHCLCTLINHSWLTTHKTQYMNNCTSEFVKRDRHGGNILLILSIFLYKTSIKNPFYASRLILLSKYWLEHETDGEAWNYQLSSK